MGPAGVRKEVTRGQRVRAQALEATGWTEGAGGPSQVRCGPKPPRDSTWPLLVPLQGRGLLSTRPTLLSPLGPIDQQCPAPPQGEPVLWAQKGPVWACKLQGMWECWNFP